MSITSKSARIAELAPWVKLAHEHRGWQPDVEPTRSGPPPPWNYRNRAIELAHQSRALIDLGTGGGEQFAQICQGFEGKAVATESWTRNVPVASALLHPLGVQVVKASSLNLPFGDSSFDLLLNRHERFAAAEAARVLKQGGTLLTQQVGPTNWIELTPFFPRPSEFRPHTEFHQDQLRANGLTIITALNDESPVTFSSLGELVYMLTLAPWNAPGLDIEQDLETLLAVEESLSTEHGLLLTEALYLIEASK